MPQKITLYPIYALASAHEDRPFDAALPYAVTEDVALEDVTPLFNAATWEWVGNELGNRDIEELRGVRHALVHRYATPGTPQGDHEPNTKSITLMHNLAALLRLIRPMRQMALLMQGELQENHTLNVQYFEHPIGLLDVPQVQKLFHLRTQDAESLHTLAPKFLQAMPGEFWKFRMAVEFHEAGHFLDGYWKARYTLWCSALEAIYTSQGQEHKGSNVAREHIKWFLGPTTPIYPQGDIPHYFEQSALTIQDVVADIYEVRNFIAHGDKIPDDYYTRT